jgi:biopolymer transport protein ExbD
MAMAVAGKGRFDLKQNSDINVTPFVDIMLVLLIVMMVTAPMATVAVNMDIPPSHNPTTPTRPPTIVSLTEDGGLSVTMGAGKVQPTSVDRLRTDVAASLQGETPATAHVFIRADRHVSYRRFMDVVSSLKLAGYQHFGVVSEDLSTQR